MGKKGGSLLGGSVVWVCMEAPPSFVMDVGTRFSWDWKGARVRKIRDV